MTLFVKSSDPEIKSHREFLCRKVGELISCQSSKRNLLSFIDDQDSSELRQQFGASNRGAYAELSGLKTELIPAVVMPHLTDHDGAFLYDDLIYVHGSTCQPDVSLVITYAHEMQHFVQRSMKHKLKEVNKLFWDLRQHLGFTNWQDHPIEQEAILTSKRIANKICGQAIVDEYVSSQREHWKLFPQEKSRWQYFGTLAAESSFDLAEVTDQIIQIHREVFERHIRDFYSADSVLSALDFSEADWYLTDDEVVS